MRSAKLLAVAALVAAASFARTVTVTLLATTDMHGNLLAWDYYSAKPVDRGLARIATLIREVRDSNPNTVLVDCGDTIQGAPLESVYQYYVQHGRLPLGQALPPGVSGDPMMRAMNAVGYDAMVLGNHEFNYGLKNIAEARAAARFPWISANTKTTPGSRNEAFQPYIVKSIAGVKVAVIGITTPGIPYWDEPEHWKGYEFRPGREAAANTVEEVRMKEHPDIVVIAAHMGLGADLSSGQILETDLNGENSVYEIARSVPGIDAIVFGHTYNRLEGARIGDVLVMQPKNWAASLGRIDFTMDDADGKWRIQRKESSLVPVTAQTSDAPDLVRLAQPYHAAAERYLESPVASSTRELSSSAARIEDSALIDAIQSVQMYYAKADVSFASAFNTRVQFPEGPVTVREIAALYVYDNTLYAVEGTGKMVRAALENAARFYNSCESDCSRGPLINPKIVGYNYDMAEGIDYEVDLTRPAGQRIRNLTYRGRPLADDQKLRIAVNNYRYGGSGGYTMFRGAPVLWRSSQEIRELMIEYYTERKTFPSAPDNNWRVVPEQARDTLRREMLSSGSR
jgi:2',3'-cyclic-nucleotide 2'-phosphodiesterase/3'-nucleotidase